MSSHISMVGIRSAEPTSAIILGLAWRIIDAPAGSLAGGAEVQLDFVDSIIWLSASMLPCRRAAVLADAIRRATEKAIALLPSTEHPRRTRAARQ